ncbi:sigma-70 family RNA polymerase sigma factor [Streptococcus cuniculipharyngis]|uniref:Sigma-70 family RNA polymerase sigma factor n=2 Tax=Streptococcus cuniculipharyngis TaxID=1562651 RepID=A0A5C5SGP8_9STRE|nr:sigma-70 family RNA polymerase sigma factor [Streptococcus cuniculipharyngis]TWS99298.1 sigma-70 family RNA polymerase sigma factor [Streptococcus cuniculipharyngis]
MSSDRFEKLYRKVRPTVMKLERQYHIKLWSVDDWEQEGMLILYQLCKRYPEVIDDERLLFPYFKTKFSNYVTDVLRKQGSEKRRFNQMVYEEISELGHVLQDREIGVADYVAVKDWLRQVRESLSVAEQGQFDCLLRGERFVGRKALMSKLQHDFLQEEREG